MVSCPGGVCTKAAMHYFARCSTWKIAVMQAVFCGISDHRSLGFRSPFRTKILSFKSLSVAKSDFGIEVPSFRAC